MRLTSCRVVLAVAVLMLAGCAPAGHITSASGTAFPSSPSGTPTSSVSPSPASIVPEPPSTAGATPVVTPSTGQAPGYARSDAVRACTILRNNGFSIPGATEALSQAASAAQSAANSDPQWQSLASLIATTATDYTAMHDNPNSSGEHFQSDLDALSTACAKIGITLFVD